jgi:hypothetical protein
MSESELDKVTEVNQKFLSGMKILMSGQKLPYGSAAFSADIGLAKTNTDGVQLYFVVGDDHVMGLEWPLDFVWQWLTNLSDEVITMGLANITLTQIHHKTR